MKTKLEETNGMRKLMGLPLIVEQTENIISERAQVLMHWSDSNTVRWIKSVDSIKISEKQDEIQLIKDGEKWSYIITDFTIIENPTGVIPSSTAHDIKSFDDTTLQLTLTNGIVIGPKK